MKTLLLGSFVRCAESVPCPCCGGQLSVIGSRRRKCKTSSGQTRVLIIRRLRCVQCGRIHHELPDCLVPYTRYESASIKCVVSKGSESSDVAADNATLYLLRVWFIMILPYFLSCLNAIAIRLGQDPVEEPSVPTLSAHQRIGLYVGHTSGWLAGIVRPIVNTNSWVHTRSAFLPGSA
ncbi:DUF6431 domain-containing protein [Acididesulfobacillus acetoxydans]|uniref:DUF6431 domain-containing protein n=1 Tax=Acididesulfobacillus acetoxydans TaxID=1561005 RepID=UPI001F0D7C37|nr:DUF6431 domain-containing protein [Acididesulfobacillus acetoxydans]